jgi:DNA-binding GntR family transcriptional regulator
VTAPVNGARARFERICNDLRERICMLDHPPGARLSEEELAEAYCVSRTPMRRVLAQLEAEGLVAPRRGVGTIVTDARVDDLEDIYRLRMELAVLIGRLSPLPRSAADLARIRDLIARCDAMAAIPGADARGFARLNRDFHLELAGMIGNAPLREINNSLYVRTFRIWLQCVPVSLLAEEAALFRREMSDILAAMEIGDLEAVGHIRRSHISMSYFRIRRYARQ